MSDAERAEALKRRFWKEIESSPFVMLAFRDTDESEMRPMTAQIEDKKIWFFGSRSDDLVGKTGSGRPAVAAFAAKGHDYFASIFGRIVPEQDVAMIDRLWSPAVAAWYDKGREDPDLILVRFDAQKADLWDASAGSLLKAAYHRVTGGDPVKEVAEDQRAEIAL